MNPPPAETSAPARKIGGILLAAGQSARMGGENKLLLPWRGAPLICRPARTMNAALQSGVLQCARVVCGRDAEKIRAAVARELAPHASFVFNEEYESGIASSLQCGLRAMRSENADAVLVMLGDMPRVDAADIRAVAAAFAKTGGDIVAPVFGGRRGNPALLSARACADAMRLRGDIGARALFAKYDVVEAATGDGVLFDIDSPADREAR